MSPEGTPGVSGSTASVPAASVPAASVPTCSGLTRTLEVDPAGTASAIRSWVLLEHAAPWGEQARDQAFRGALGEQGWDRLQRLWPAEQLRPLLIRRPGRRRTAEPASVFVGAAHGGHRWMERLAAQGLRGVDLEAVAAGRPGHGEPVDGPLFAVCTNGSVDRCCAVRGRPLAAALAAVHPEQTWEVSHVGGCHFAANLLVLPDAVLHGALTAETGLQIAAAALQGHTDPALMRGRAGVDGSAVSAFAATAEVALRRLLGPAWLDELTVLKEQPHADSVAGEQGPEPAGADVLLSAGGRTWRAAVRARALGEHISVCGGIQPLTTTDVVELVPWQHEPRP
jgi:hypothetical protein